MSELVATFYPTMFLWTRSTKMIHSSGVPESNLEILITYIPEVVPLGVLWCVWSICSKALSSLSSGLRDIWFNQFPRATLLLFGDTILHCLMSSYLAICGEVTILYPMLKIGQCKSLFSNNYLDARCCGSVWRQLWLLVVNQFACIMSR